jgi:hypothetical protein
MAPTQSSGNKFILVLLLCSALLLIAGYFTSHLFLEGSIYLLNGIGVTASAMDEVFRHRLYLSAICAAIPWLFLLARKAGKASNWKQYLFTGISMVLSGSIFWYLRIYSLRDYHAELASQGGSMQYVFDFNMLRFELHLAIGILIGGLLATVILHRFNRNLPANPFRKSTHSKFAGRK